MVFMNITWLRVLLLLFIQAYSSNARSTTQEQPLALKAITGHRTDALSNYLSAKRSGKSSPPPQLESSEYNTIDTIQAGISKTLNQLESKLSPKKFSRLNNLTQCFTESLIDPERKPPLLKKGGCCRLRTENFGFVDRTLTDFFFTGPLTKGEMSLTEPVTAVYTYMVELCLLMQQLIEKSVTENNYTFSYENQDSLFGFKSTKQVLNVAYVCSVSSAILQWTLDVERIPKQLRGNDSYRSVQQLLTSDEKVACIEYVTFSIQILEILDIDTTRAATLVGSNPFPGKLNKFNAIATSFFAHNFLKITLDGREVGIEPLRKNFNNKSYCPFPIYNRAIGLHALLPLGFSSYLIWHYILFPMIQDLTLEGNEPVYFAFPTLPRLFEIYFFNTVQAQLTSILFD